MSDWDSYPSWNPFIVKVHIQPGKAGHPEKMLFRLVWHNGRKGSSREQMILASPPNAGSAELQYKYNALIAKLGLLKATRIQQLTAIGNQTEYFTREDYVGCLARFVPIKAVSQGFAKQAKALAVVAEAAAEPKNGN